MPDTITIEPTKATLWKEIERLQKAGDILFVVLRDVLAEMRTDTGMPTDMMVAMDMALRQWCTARRVATINGKPSKAAERALRELLRLAMKQHGA